MNPKYQHSRRILWIKTKSGFFRLKIQVFSWERINRKYIWQVVFLRYHSSESLPESCTYSLEARNHAFWKIQVRINVAVALDVKVKPAVVEIISIMCYGRTMMIFWFLNPTTTTGQCLLIHFSMHSPSRAIQSEEVCFGMLPAMTPH